MSPIRKEKIERFKIFLRSRGAEVLIPTNEYEVVRFRTGAGVSIIYTSKRGDLTYTGEANKAWDSFTKPNVPWTAQSRVASRPTAAKRSVLSRTIRERDGDDCFYCGKEVGDDHESIEHLLSLNHGGNNHVSNLVLAHLDCNLLVGHLPIIDKVKHREQMQKGVLNP